MFLKAGSSMLNASEVSVCTGTCSVFTVTISVFVSTDTKKT